ncbi:MAG: metallophosphoesterase [Mycobacteriales bacterium]
MTETDRLLAPFSQPVPLPEPQRWLGLIGDLHGETEWALLVLPALSRSGVRTVLALGDVGVWPGPDGSAYLDALEREAQRNKQLFLMLEGNHDDAEARGVPARSARGGQAPPARLAPAAGPALHLARRVFAVPGGATSLDARERRPHASWWPQEALRPHQVQRLADGGPLDVLLTHDAPAGARVPGLSTNWPEDALRHATQHQQRVREAVDAVEPALLVHGHLHVRYQDTLDLPTGRQTLVVGLAPDHTHYDDNVVVLDLPQLAQILLQPADQRTAALIRPTRLPPTAGRPDLLD